MKRILVLLALVAVIACFFAIPASAVAENNHVYIPFDQLTILSHEPLYYNFNLTDPDDGYSLAYGDDYGILLQNSVQSSCEIHVDAATSSRTTFSFRFAGSQDYNAPYELSAHNFFMRSSDLYQTFMFTPAGSDATLQHTVSMSGAIRVITEENGQYETSRRSFLVPATTFVNGIDLMALIRQQLSVETMRQSVLYFDYLYVKFENGASESRHEFKLSGQGTASYRPSFTAWFNQFDLHSYEFTPSDPSDGNFLQWIASMVDTVFNIELFGFVSINDIFNFVVVVGLVFWFLKLTV